MEKLKCKIVKIKDLIYFISDREIKEGDWIYDEGLKRVIQHFSSKINYIPLHKKIEATTNSELKYYSTHQIEGNQSWLIPQIPESFIKPYIDSYNNGKVIEDVLIEVDINGDFHNDISLKTRSDNTIIIHSIKQSYTRDEVIELLKQCAWGTHFENFNIDKWINKNL